MAKSIDLSIDFAAKRSVWQRMMKIIIRAMRIAMISRQNSTAVLLCSSAVRQNALPHFAMDNHYIQNHRDCKSFFSPDFSDLW